MKKTIVISAVNIRKGGTLTILRQCLAYLSSLTQQFRVVALVHDRKLCEYDGIEYIEMPWCVKSWGRRLWAEYVTMNGISKKLSPVYLWFSLHDTTPIVKAERRAVYCHTSFPFLKTDIQDLKFDPKIVAFSLFTRFAYRINVHANDHLVVQTSWFRDGLAKMLKFPSERIIVARPDGGGAHISATSGSGARISEVVGTSCECGQDTASSARASAECRQDTASSAHWCAPTAVPTFIFPATPDCHKGFETLCEAASILEKELGRGRFKVILTINGAENKYAQWLKSVWGHVESIDFRGFVSRKELDRIYSEAAALTFPSRIETWGLPISEFAPTGRPMILPDIPYAHETAAGAPLVRFVEPRSASALAGAMKNVLIGDLSSFKAQPAAYPAAPVAPDWAELFRQLLS